MAEDAWVDAVSGVLLHVADGGPSEDAGCRLAAAAFELGDFMVLKVELSQGVDGLSACEKGCSLCCHAQVPVSRPEAEFLSAWMILNLSDADQAEIRMRVAHNVGLTAGSSLEERLSVWDQTPCIFLHKDVCRVYPARPLVCRAWHAMDRNQCLRAYAVRDSGMEIENTPYRNYVLGVVRDELARSLPWPGGGVLPLPEAMVAQGMGNDSAPSVPIP